MPRLVAIAATLFLLVAGASAQMTIQIGQTISGTLGPGDSLLSTGEFADEYVFDAPANQPLSIRMSSGAFDCYLIFHDPDGRQTDNDDFRGTDAGLDVVLSRAGRCRLVATSFRANETGAYTLSITAGGKVR